MREINITIKILLQVLGSENIINIQRYNKNRGAFETAGFDETEQIIGVDFIIVQGERNFVYMNQVVDGFKP